MRNKRLLQIDTCLGVGSTGRITESIAQLAQSQGWECYIIHGARYVKRPSCMKDIQTVSILGEYLHYAEGMIFDNHGLASRAATRRVVEQIKEIHPDVIQMHCIHGYYLNYKILFEYFQTIETPIVWTFHDCWAFTGHCAYFDSIKCEKWKSGCHDCELKGTYPPTKFLDRSKRNYELKCRLFTSVGKQTVIVPVSYWLEDLVKQSYLKDIRVNTIHNGTDIEVFKPSDGNKLRKQLGVGNKKVVLGVALPWVPRKGMPDMIKLADMLPNDEYRVILVGLDKKQIQTLPNNVMGVMRTNSAQELAEYYSMASVFVNPTYEDNFPTTNIEALACGTPVITYKTGGSPEAVTPDTGWVVEQGNVDGIAAIVKSFDLKPELEIMTQRKVCRERAKLEFDKDKAFVKYLNLYNTLI